MTERDRPEPDRRKPGQAEAGWPEAGWPEAGRPEAGRAEGERPQAGRPELSRVVALERLGAGVTAFVVEAGAGELVALAARLGIPAVEALRCVFRLKAGGRGVVEAEGELSARLVRECVVTLEPFEVAVAEAFRVRFVPVERIPAEMSEEELLDLESDDEIGYEGASLDLGEAAAEQLALGLDPYPRRPGVELPADDPEDPGVVAPFAALAALRKT